MLPSHTERSARRSLGQNFLIDQNTARRIVDALAIEPGDRVLEIGPGAGALTRWLAASDAAAVLALERDPYWAGAIKQALPRVEVIHADALEFAWERLTTSRPWKVIGNLPYNVASPLLWELCSRAEGLVRGVFMVQKEVAQRIAARPGNKDYGALSVWLQSFVRPRLAFTVGPKVFRPRPHVDSAVLVVEPLPRAARPSDPEALSQLLKRCFQNRRKQLRNILRAYWTPELEATLAADGLQPEIRPEALSVAQMQSLAQRIPWTDGLTDAVRLPETQA